MPKIVHSFACLEIFIFFSDEVLAFRILSKESEEALTSFSELTGLFSFRPVPCKAGTEGNLFITLIAISSPSRYSFGRILCNSLFCILGRFLKYTVEFFILKGFVINRKSNLVS